MSLLLLFNQLDDGSTPPPPPAESVGGGFVTRDSYHADHEHLSKMTLIATMSALLAAGVLQ